MSSTHSVPSDRHDGSLPPNEFQLVRVLTEFCVSGAESGYVSRRVHARALARSWRHHSGPAPPYFQPEREAEPGRVQQAGARRKVTYAGE
jgi:hypothetical protein